MAEAEAGAGYNYAANRDSAYNSNQFDARVDERFNQKLQGFARFTFKDLTLLDPQDLNVQSLTDFDNYRILASSLIYTFTPSLLNEFRFGFTNETNGIRNELNGAPYTAAAGFRADRPNLSGQWDHCYLFSGRPYNARGRQHQSDITKPSLPIYGQPDLEQG